METKLKSFSRARSSIRMLANCSSFSGTQTGLFKIFQAGFTSLVSVRRNSTRNGPARPVLDALRTTWQNNFNSTCYLFLCFGVQQLSVALWGPAARAGYDTFRKDWAGPGPVWNLSGRSWGPTQISAWEFVWLFVGAYPWYAAFLFFSLHHHRIPTAKLKSHLSANPRFGTQKPMIKDGKRSFETK